MKWKGWDHLIQEEVAKDEKKKERARIAREKSLQIKVDTKKEDYEITNDKPKDKDELICPHCGKSFDNVNLVLKLHIENDNDATKPVIVNKDAKNDIIPNQENPLEASEDFIKN